MKSFICSDIDQLVLIGAGGNGSYIAESLAKIVSGFNLNINVSIFDADIIESANVYRQNFKMYEVGDYKSEALVNRLNMEYGTSFEYHNQFFDKDAFHMIKSQSHHMFEKKTTVFITAVDNMKIRRNLASWLAESRNNKDIFIDCGNLMLAGQVIIGTSTNPDIFETTISQIKDESTNYVTDLPCANLLFPDAYAEEDTPKTERTCLASPFDEQSVLVNQFIANAVCSALADMLIKNKLDYSEIYISSNPPKMTPNQIIESRYEFLVQRYKNDKQKTT